MSENSDQFGANEFNGPAAMKRAGNYLDFSEYMSMKENKLRAQFECPEVTSDIFNGVCIHVNGSTSPPLSVLRDLILKHGGAFEQYFHRDRVTHFICTHVAKAKLNNFIQRSRGKIKVMKPEWIVDSIKAGKLLDEFDYRVYLQEDSNQNSLHKYFGKDVDSKIEIESDTSDEELIEDIENDQNFKDSDSDSSNEITEDFALDGIELLADMMDFEDDGTIDEKDSIDASQFHSIPSLDTKTSADPDFLVEYYKNSRLHHLSTWREELKTYALSLMKSKNNLHKQAKATINDRIIMHVDLDCFFVSVSLLSHPQKDELINCPIAVSHARNDNSNVVDSSADISSCNYIARGFGLKNGMYIREAMKLCPELKIISYDFDNYKKVARRFYEILSESADELQAVSCDEAYLEILDHSLNPEHVANDLRDRIRKECFVEASVGIGPNMLIARMATRIAKPSGQFFVKNSEIESFMANQLIKDLPGVGSSILSKLPKNMIKCSDLSNSITLNDLQTKLGYSIGLGLFQKLRGQDDRPVSPESDRKSVGSEVSWGVRFSSMAQCRRFLDEMAKEVWQRMTDAFSSISEPRPRKIQIKLHRRQEGSGASKKRLGRGICDVFHRSKQFPRGITSEASFLTEVWTIFELEMIKRLKTIIDDIRGIGIFLSDFTCTDIKLSKRKHEDILDLLQNKNGKRKEDVGTCNNWVYESESIDMDVLAELPIEIQNELRGQKLLKTNVSKIDSDNNNNNNKDSVISNSKSFKKPKISANNHNTKTLTQMWGKREEREIRRLQEEILNLPSDQFDHNVILVLPIELQKEIIDQWRNEERLKKIKPSEENETFNEDPKINKEVLVLEEKFPISFQDQQFQWTGEQLHCFLLKNMETSDVDILNQIEEILINLTIHECLKPLSDSCNLLKRNSNFNNSIEKIRTLVKDLFGSNINI